MDKMSDSHNDNIDDPSPKEQIIVDKSIPTPGIVYDDKYIKKDLIKIFILVIFFTIAIIILYYLDKQSSFINNISNNLINFLTSR